MNNKETQTIQWNQETIPNQMRNLTEIQKLYKGTKQKFNEWMKFNEWRIQWMKWKTVEEREHQ